MCVRRHAAATRTHISFIELGSEFFPVSRKMAVRLTAST